ncbi:PEP-CTERM sorting domain-containing protein [Mucisphaera sp.]|uniref:PEP-CTERM sorting domain-containing protein n=1 Tax=Mucisphaera sp. TaxID=2913024 RepID=UPI003D0DC9D4
MRFAWDASFDGSVIVGETGGPIGQSAFRYSDAEGFMNLGRFESRSTATAFRVSGDGSTVVGRSGTKAFRWTAETGMVALTDNDGNDLEAIAFAVNSDGSVVGGGVTSGPLIGPTVWDDSLGLISLDLEPGEVRGRVIDMTPDASIFVGTTDRNFGSVFTSSIGEGLTTLQQGPFLNDIVSSVSADGSVLVGADGFGPSIWEDGRILPFDLWMRDQYGVDFGRWQIIEVTGVSDDGLVFTGRGRDGPGGYAQGWYLVIPEPSSAALFSFALGLGLARRS